MAYTQSQSVTIADLLAGTFDELRGIPLQLVMYMVAFLTLGILADLGGPVARGVLGFLTIPAYFVGQYYLYQSMLRRSGLAVDPKFKALGMCGLAFIILIPIGIGLNVFYLPGLLLAAKWVLAPTIYVARDRSVFHAMTDSWEATNNNLISLSVAFLVLTVIWSVVFIPVVLLGTGLNELIRLRDGSEPQPTTLWLAFHLLLVVLLGLSVPAYRATAMPEETLVDRLAQPLAPTRAHP